jgi:glycosyltransferase involved in cell wall biosynthesis
VKICFVTSQIITNYATMKRALGMATPLSSLGHDITIYLQDADENREAIEKYLDVKAAYFSPGSLQYERNQKQLFLKNNHFDVIHICGLGFRNAIFPQSLKNSLVIMDHSELESSFKGVSIIRRLLQAFLEWWSLFAYEGSIAASRYLEFLFRRRLHRFGLQRSLLWLPYAYDPFSLVQTDISVSSLRNSYPGQKIIVYLGGLYQNYGCFEMLEAFRILAQQGSDFVALILGKGPEKDKAIEFIKKHGLEQWVELKGYIPEAEVPNFLYGADVLLSPLNDTVTDWARCPSKLLMYMATKKPIVTCAIGEAWEYLKSDGFYYQPNSVDSMATAIKKAMSESDIWIPNYDPSQHTWEQRVHTWLDWVYRINPNLIERY